MLPPGAPPPAPSGNAGGRSNGALIIATAGNTSGRTRAHQPAIGEPKSWPTTPATCSSPSRRTSASTSRTRLR